MVEGGMKCVKYLLFIFNLFFFLAGLGLIITGALVQTKFRDYFEFFENSNLSAVAIFLIVVGGIIFVIGFFGCCGAYKENYCMTMTFAVLLGIIFILEIAAGITAYVMRNEVQSFLQKEMNATIPQYNGKEGVTKAWNVMQTDLKCCGLNNYTDWRINANLSASNSLPDSCCKTYTLNCGKGQLSKPTNYNSEPCLDKFVVFVQANIYAVGGVGIGLAFVQIVGIILSCCLARTIKKEYEVV